MEILTTIWAFLGDNTAEIIAFCALLFTAYQFMVSRHHNKLMVTPHLCLETNYEISDKEYEWEVILKNSGIGPAIINKLAILIDGKELNEVELKKLQTIIEGFLEKPIKGFMFNIYSSGYAIGEKEDDILLSFVVPVNISTKINELENKLDKIDVYIEYKSLYGREYTFDSRIQKNK